MPMSDLPLHHGSGLNPGPTRGKGFASHASASMLSQPDVFTTDEIARAAGVPRAAVQRLVDTGELKPVAGSDFFDTRAAVRAGRRARHEAAALDTSVPESTLPPGTNLREEQGFSAVASSLLHVAVLAALHLVNVGSGRNGRNDAARIDSCSWPDRDREAVAAAAEGPRERPSLGSRSRNQRQPSRFTPEPRATSLAERSLHRWRSWRVKISRSAPEAEGTGPGVGPGRR